MSKPVCLVVGLGQKGIGDHVAKKFAKEGYQIAMMARTEATLRSLEEEIGGTSIAKGYQVDATNNAQVIDGVKKVESELGPIDVLIYNAGMGFFKSFADTSAEDFDACLKAGPSGLFYFTKAVTPGMINRGKGVIGITGATASWRCMPFTTAFAPAKFAVRALSQGLARDLGPKNIHVFHVIIDGIVDQPRTNDWMPEKAKEEYLQPESIANTYYMISQQDKSAWTTELNLAPGSVMKDMVNI